MKKRIALFTLLVIGILVLGFHQMKAQRLQETYLAIAKDCVPEKPASQGALINTLRACVHANSVHNMDEEFYRDWRDPQKMADNLRAYQSGKTKDKPHFECSTRSTVLKALYEIYKIPAYDVIFAKYEKEYPEHVVIEAFNSDTKAWELHDPTYDIYFANKKESGKPLTAMDLLSDTSGSDIVPCTTPDNCGWDVAYGQPGEDYLKAYWGLYRVKNMAADKWQPYYRPDRFDISKPLEAYGSIQTFCTAKPKYCAMPPVVIATQ